MSDPTIWFVKALAKRFPSLNSLLDEHIEDNFGETLPHVFFGDVTRHAVSLFRRVEMGGDLGARKELRELLDVLEESFVAGDEPLRELIAASFLENLPARGEDGAQIRSMLGTTLSQQLGFME